MATDTAPPPVAPATPPANDGPPPMAYPAKGDPKGGFLKSFSQLKADHTAPKAPAEPVAPVVSPPAPSTPEKPAVAPTAPVKKEAASTVTPPVLKKGLAALADDEPAESVTTETPEDDEVPDDVKTPEGKSSFIAIKREVKALKTEKTSWETERTKLTEDLAAAKKISDADPVKKEAEALKARIAEIEPILARTEYKQSPEYKRAVDTPMRNLLTDAASLAVRNSIDQSKIEAALWEGDEKRQNEALDELADTMPGKDKNLLYGLANKLQELIVLDDELSKNASTALAEANALAEERASLTKNERRAAEMRKITESKALLEKSVRYFKQDGETDEAAIKSILEDANAVPLDEMDPDTLVDSKIMSLVAPRALRNLKVALGKIAALEAEIAGLSSSAPRTTNGTAGTSSVAGEKKIGGFRESMREGMAAGGR